VFGVLLTVGKKGLAEMTPGMKMAYEAVKQGD
jgi:hypothetical protein